jgi:nicotinamide-nucleotide amidase
MLEILSLLDSLKKAKAKLVTAESCTGGLVAAAITDFSGVSSVYERGFITYSNEAKTEELGVPAELIEKYGAVSPEVAKSMAEGAISNSRGNISVAITGIAGPTGGSAEKPVGLVYIATSYNGNTNSQEFSFTGSRDDIRQEAVAKAIELLEAALSV